ncbi:uncharacterized protein LOC143257799 [Tachypleus tridentatus]|uniref:uncharacterized protein LOC143257799 n=1 Tax=Tachypleus tridentatus TaxID=6853 RepID=UPI003FD2F716
MILGSSCKSSFVCLLFISNSFCDSDDGICRCRPYYVQYNDSTCLPPSLLGFGCAVDAQCRVKVKNTHCVSGLCNCLSNFIPLRRDKCLPVAKVGEYCLSHEQCRLSDKYTYCDWILPNIYGKCRCPMGYLYRDDERCLPHLGNKCKSSDDCEAATPGAYCKKHKKVNSCNCREGLKSSKNKLRCEPKSIQGLEGERFFIRFSVEVVSIGKMCVRNSQCQARDPYSTCINGSCQCLSKTSYCNPKNTSCHKDTFQCRNGQCISWFFVCDSQKNCVDGSDENECIRYKCPLEAFQCNDGTCLSRSVVCNGKWECPDGSDEARCYKGISCDKHSFQCANGQCFPQYVLCNAVTDCSDGSDEFEAICARGEKCSSNEYLCNNGQCRSTAILCSGLDGCGDNSDEEKCEVCYCEKP